MKGAVRWLDDRLWEAESSEGVEVHDVDGAPAVHQCFGEPIVAYFWSHDEGAPPGVFDPAGVVFAAPADWLLGPVEVASGVSGDGVDRDRSREDLLFPAVIESNEGVERAHFAAKSWVVIAGLMGVGSPVVAVVVVAVVVPVAPYLFDLFERLALAGRVPGREPFFAVEDARLVHCGDCVELLDRSSSVATRGVAA